MHLRILKLILIIIVCHVQKVYTRGTVAIRLIDFVNPSLTTASNECCEKGFLWRCQTNACDPAFSICLSDDAKGTCSIGQLDTDVTPDTDRIKFGPTLGNITNPIIFTFEKWKNRAFLSIKVCNGRCNKGQNNLIIDEYNYTLSLDPETNGQLNHIHTISKTGKRSRLKAEIQLTCDQHHYGDCTRMCKPNPFRYYCDCTGHKICNSGWAGEKCDIQIDQCAINKCQNNGTCINAIYGHMCVCGNGFTGNGCEIEIKKATQTTTATTPTSRKLPSVVHKSSTYHIVQTNIQEQRRTTESPALHPTQSNSANRMHDKTTIQDETTTLKRQHYTRNYKTQHTESTTGNKLLSSDNNTRELDSKSLRRSGSNMNRIDNGMVLSPGGVVGIAVSLVGLVLISVIVVKLVRWCRMKEKFVINDGSSTSSESGDIESFDNQAIQSEWMYYRT